MVAAVLLVGLVVAPTPSGAAGTICTTVAPVVVGSTGTGMVVRQGECSSVGRTGYRIFAYRDGSTTPETSVDAVVGGRQVEVPGLVPGAVYRFRESAIRGTDEGVRSGLSAPASVAPFVSAATAADQIYGDFVDRAPTAAELADIRTTVGAWPPTTPISAEIDRLQGSAHWQVRSPVIRLFRAYFLRLPDAGGLDYWVRKSRAGTRLRTISSSFAASSEFARRYGTLTDRQFVELVYQNVLGRPGDAGGISYWTGKLAARTTDRGGVMVGFSESGEYQRKTAALVDVVNVYGGMLRRVPTSTELAEWVGRPRLELIEALYASPAYLARAAEPAPPVVDGVPAYAEAGIGQPIAPIALSVRFGRAPFRWKLVGTVPAGLTVSSAGVVSGTPTTKGSYDDVGVQVTDADGRVGGASFEFFLVQDFLITPSELPPATVGVDYVQPPVQLGASGATGKVVFQTTDALPGGIGMFPSGRFFGTPTSAGTFGFGIEATDEAGHRSVHTFFLTVLLAPG